MKRRKAQEEKPKKKWMYYVKFSLYMAVFLLGIVLLFLPADYFDEGDSVCLSKSMFNVECYGCGMTRAVMHLIHFNFLEAYQYNKLAFIVVPLLIFLIVSDFIKLVKDRESYK